MSNSVWYKEVDTAMCKLIKDLIDPKIQIFFNTQRDLIKETPKYPYAKIVHLGEQFAFDRYDPLRQITAIDNVKGTITVEESALPYDLNYQLELISNSNNLHNTTSMKWASKVKPFFNLPVIDNGGQERLCFVSSTKPITIEEITKEDKTIFRYVIRLKIRVELDETTSHDSPLITDGIDINM